MNELNAAMFGRAFFLVALVAFQSLVLASSASSSEAFAVEEARLQSRENGVAAAEARVGQQAFLEQQAEAQLQQRQAFEEAKEQSLRTVEARVAAKASQVRSQEKSAAFMETELQMEQQKIREALNKRSEEVPTGLAARTYRDARRVGLPLFRVVEAPDHEIHPKRRAFLQESRQTITERGGAPSPREEPPPADGSSVYIPGVTNMETPSSVRNAKNPVSSLVQTASGTAADADFTATTRESDLTLVQAANLPPGVGGEDDDEKAPDDSAGEDAGATAMADGVGENADNDDLEEILLETKSKTTRRKETASTRPRDRLLVVR